MLSMRRFASIQVDADQAESIQHGALDDGAREEPVGAFCLTQINTRQYGCFRMRVTME